MFSAHLHARRTQSPKGPIAVESFEFAQIGEAGLLGAYHCDKGELERELCQFVSVVILESCQKFRNLGRGQRCPGRPARPAHPVGGARRG